MIRFEPLGEGEHETFSCASDSLTVDHNSLTVDHNLRPELSVLLRCEFMMFKYLDSLVTNGKIHRWTLKYFKVDTDNAYKWWVHTEETQIDGSSKFYIYSIERDNTYTGGTADDAKYEMMRYEVKLQRTEGDI